MGKLAGKPNSIFTLCAWTACGLPIDFDERRPDARRPLRREVSSLSSGRSAPTKAISDIIALVQLLDFLSCINDDLERSSQG